MEADPDAICELLYALFGEQTITPLPERPAYVAQTTLSSSVIAGDAVEENTTPAYKNVFEQTSDLPSYTREPDLGTP